LWFGVGYVAEDAEQRIIIAGLFKFFDVARKDLSARSTLPYGISSELIAVLERSQRWGRIKAEVFCAMNPSMPWGYMKWRAAPEHG
jgi:hypothetical protein